MNARKPDALEQLAALIDARLSRPFSWGDHDCCLFAADCVKVQTGHDPAQVFRGRYHTAIGAGRVLKNEGFSSLAELAVSSLGQPLANANFAKRGDIALIEHPVLSTGLTAGVVWSGGVIAPASDGLMTIPADFIVNVWSV